MDGSEQQCYQHDSILEELEEEAYDDLTSCSFKLHTLLIKKMLKSGEITIVINDKLTLEMISEITQSQHNYTNVPVMENVPQLQTQLAIQPTECNRLQLEPQENGGTFLSSLEEPFHQVATDVYCKSSRQPLDSLHKQEDMPLPSVEELHFKQKKLCNDQEVLWQQHAQLHQQQQLLEKKLTELQWQCNAMQEEMKEIKREKNKVEPQVLAQVDEQGRLTSSEHAVVMGTEKAEILLESMKEVQDTQREFLSQLEEQQRTNQQLLNKVYKYKCSIL